MHSVWSQERSRTTRSQLPPVSMMNGGCRDKPVWISMTTDGHPMKTATENTYRYTDACTNDVNFSATAHICAKMGSTHKICWFECWVYCRWLLITLFGTPNAEMNYTAFFFQPKLCWCATGCKITQSIGSVSVCAKVRESWVGGVVEVARVLGTTSFPTF